MHARQLPGMHGQQTCPAKLTACDHLLIGLIVASISALASIQALTSVIATAITLWQHRHCWQLHCMVDSEAQVATAKRK